MGGGRRIVRSSLVVLAAGLLIFLLSALGACSSPGGPAPVREAYHGGEIPTYYKVQRGDTLYSIAFTFNQDVRRLAARNRVRRPYTIYPDQKLRIKPYPKRKTSAKKPRTSSNKKKKPPKSANVKKPKTTASSNTKTAEKSKSRKSGKSVAAQKSPSGKTRWRWPTAGQVIETFSASDPLRKGIDIAGKAGSPVLAAADGRVVYAGSGLRGYGKLIIVKHNDEFLSAYAHNRKLLVKEGVTVKSGQRIAEMGNTGTNKVKLHFEVRRDGTPVNPLHYLPKKR